MAFSVGLLLLANLRDLGLDEPRVPQQDDVLGSGNSDDGDGSGSDGSAVGEQRLPAGLLEAEGSAAGGRDGDDEAGMIDAVPVVAPLYRPQPCSGSAKGAPARFSQYRCVESKFDGSARSYGLPLFNRSCYFEGLTFRNGKFQYYVATGSAATVAKSLPPVSLSPRVFDLPIQKKNKRKVVAKMHRFHEWRPQVVVGPIPCDAQPPPVGSSEDTILAYYSPIVAPWNYAHTLLCDLFGLYWAMAELHLVRPDVQVVAVGAHYGNRFRLPNKNAAFRLFSRKPPMYDHHLRQDRVYNVVAGTGTKAWSWVTDEYSAAGSTSLWFAFRKFVIDVVGAKDRAASPVAVRAKATAGPGGWSAPVRRAPSTPLRVALCHKKDKRGVVNYEEARAFLQEAFPRDDVRLESAVGLSARDQVQMMINTDVYVCNEGTLATGFFFMPPGSAFVSLPLVYHGPHIHQRRMPPPEQWWRLPDPLRPDPRKNTGGNIDWFPPAIRWVRTSWYDYVPLNETRIQLPLRGLRNYMPDYNIILRRERLVPLLASAVQAVRAPPQGDTVDYPNYSRNAKICRSMLQRAPELTHSFNSAKCLYGMSWLCEMWSNTEHRWRALHNKWHTSTGHCGDLRTYAYRERIVDDREARPLSEFLYYTREQLEESYTTTDFARGMHASPSDLRIFDGTNATSSAARPAMKNKGGMVFGANGARRPPAGSAREHHIGHPAVDNHQRLLPAPPPMEGDEFRLR